MICLKKTLHRSVSVQTACILVGWSLLLCRPGFADDTTPLKVLLVDGQNNHKWKQTSPIIKVALESCGRFTVDVATSPAQGEDMSAFAPKFSDYDVIVSNYNGADWPVATQEAFDAYIKEGGGLVSVHAADNAFGNWTAYNRMIGLGGWNGRNEESGPYVYFNDEDKLIRDESKGSGGSHGPQHEFTVIVRDADHPITKGLPKVWLHTKDELYSQLRGPAESMHVLATAYADKSQRGTGRHEPMLMTIDYEKGRVFHTTLGHADYSMYCVGFVTTLQRGTEWAATGKVTLAVRENFPGPNAAVVWESEAVAP